MPERIRKFAFEAEGLCLFLLIALQFIAVPGTYGYLLSEATGWTWYNLIPRAIGYAVSSAFWALYWPFSFIFS